jgi:hypothetical protein
MTFLPRALAILTAIHVAGTAGAAAGPCTPPASIATYLKTHAGWHILDVSDLDKDSRSFWREEHSGKCPGLTRVVVDETHLTSFGLALVSDRGGKVVQKIILLQAKPGGGYNIRTLMAASEGKGLVIWRQPPLRMKDYFGSGRSVSTRYDGVVIERPESASRLYYLRNGKVRMIQLGD